MKRNTLDLATETRRLYQSGLSYEQVAKKMKVTAGTIRYRLRLVGQTPRRRGAPNRTHKHSAAIRRRRDAGHSWNRIADYYGKTRQWAQQIYYKKS